MKLEISWKFVKPSSEKQKSLKRETLNNGGKSEYK